MPARCRRNESATISLRHALHYIIQVHIIQSDEIFLQFSHFVGLDDVNLNFLIMHAGDRNESATISLQHALNYIIQVHIIQSDEIFSQFKVSFFGQCSKMQLIQLKNFSIKTCFIQFLWFFRLKCWFKGQIYVLSIGSTETKYIKLNTKTQTILCC